MSETPLGPAPEQLAPSLHVLDASPAWRLIFQSGVLVACTVGIPLEVLLRHEFALTERQIRLVDVLLLEGMPVDAPETAVVPDNARLALAAGLPGIAGLAMKKGSAVAALRAGITHTRNAEACPRPGHVRLFLYSLALPLLAGHFLQRGVLADAAQLARYSRFSPEDSCRFDSRPMAARELEAAFSGLPDTTRILLTAHMRDGEEQSPAKENERPG